MAKTMTVFEAVAKLQSLKDKTAAFETAFALLEEKGDTKSIEALSDVKAHYEKTANELESKLNALSVEQ